MKQRLFLIVLIVLLTGCDSSYTFEEISIDQTNDHVQAFMRLVENENGNYLYLDGEKDIYVFLNGIYVKRGNDAAYFSDFNVSAQQGTLNMFINQEYDSDYLNPTLNYQVLYKIYTVEKYDEINLYVNGKPVAFDKIDINGQCSVEY